MPDDPTWLFDLISDDPALRAAAITRARAADLRFWPGADYRHPGEAKEYAVLFLRWEALAPDDWYDRDVVWSPYNAKRWALASLVRTGVPPESVPVLEDLIMGAVHRTTRREDDGYWRLARLLDGPRLRSALLDATDHPAEGTRLRAGFLLHLLLHPDATAHRQGWKHWRRVHGRRCGGPRSPAALTAMPPVSAAALLATLDPAHLAYVLEGLENGPGGRILAHLAERAVAAPALERTDARLASRLLRVLPPQVAAGLLTRMEPRVAAERFPGRTAWDVIPLLPPELVGRMLPWLPPNVADWLLPWIFRRSGGLTAAETAGHLLTGEPARVARLLELMSLETQAALLAEMPEHVVEEMLSRWSGHAVRRLRGAFSGPSTTPARR